MLRNYQQKAQWLSSKLPPSGSKVGFWVIKRHHNSADLVHEDLQAQYSSYKSNLQQIAQKIGDVEQETEEHKYRTPCSLKTRSALRRIRLILSTSSECTYVCASLGALLITEWCVEQACPRDLRTSTQRPKMFSDDQRGFDRKNSEGRDPGAED